MNKVDVGHDGKGGKEQALEQDGVVHVCRRRCARDRHALTIHCDGVFRAALPRSVELVQLLGDASYSIYLVHFFVLSLLAKVAWSSGVARRLPASLVFRVICGLAVGAGTLCHLLVECPLLALLNRQTVTSAVGPGVTT